MLRLTRLLARKPPGFTSKLSKQPETAAKLDLDDSEKDKAQNPDYMKEMQNIVNTLQDKLRTAKPTSDSKTTNSETPKSATEENDGKFTEHTLGKKRKTVTEDKNGNKSTNYEYHIEMDGGKIANRVGQLFGFLLGFWLFQEFLPVSGDKGQHENTPDDSSSSTSSPYGDQTRPNELQYRNVNEMYEQRQQQADEQQMQAEINAYNELEQDSQNSNVSQPGFKTWENQNNSDGFSSYKGSKFDR